MHICFILDNSLTMAQKSANNLSLLDQAKSSVELTFRSLIRSNKFTAQDIVHLYITSSVEPLSSFQHSQLHFLHQLKSIQFNILSYPAQVISSALQQIGKFRALNQSQTLLGYRQGTIFEPCLIIFLTDRSSVKHLTKINNYLKQNKLAMRSEYQFLVIKFCSPSPSQRNIYTFEVFKSRVESQKQSKMTKQILQKMNGRLKFAYSCQQLNQLLLKSIQNFKPNLLMELHNKQYKIYSKDFSRTQVQLFQSSNIFQKLIISEQKYFQDSVEQSQDKILIKTQPTKKRSLIPIPFQTSSKWTNNQHIFDKFFNIKLFVDFSKEFANFTQLKNSNYFIDKYNILNNPHLKQIQIYLSSFQNISPKRFPLFYQKKSQQHLIGYIEYLPNNKNQLSSIKSNNSKQQTCWSLNISFANFTNFISCLKLLYQNNRNVNINQLFQNYVSTLPIFYIKFIQCFLQPFKLSISYDMFQNINHTVIGVNNSKLYELRGIQKKSMNAAYWKSKQTHEKSQSQCCSIYSKNFNKFQQKYSQKYNDESEFQKKLNLFLKKNLNKFAQLKMKLGIQDYLTIKKIQSLPISKQIEKYNIRRGDDDFNQNATTGFGNPFKKRRKLNNADQTSSSQFLQNSSEPKFADQPLQEPQFLQKVQIIPEINNQEEINILQNENLKQMLDMNEIHQQQQKYENKQFEVQKQKPEIHQIEQIVKNKTRNNEKQQIIEFLNNFEVSKPIFVKISKLNIAKIYFQRNMKIIEQQKLKANSKK